MSDQRTNNTRPGQNPMRGGGRNGGRPGGPMGQFMPGEKPKNFKGTMAKLLRYIGRYKFSLILVSLFSILSTVFSIFGPKIMGNATTELAGGAMRMALGTGGIDFAYIAEILIFLAGLYFASSVLKYIQTYIMTGVNNKMTYTMREEISEKINRIPLKFFDTTTHGEILSRVTNDVSTVTRSLNDSVTEIISSIATLIGVLAMMISISWQMTCIALLIIPASVLVVQFVVKRSQKHFKTQQEYLGHVNGQIEEMYSGHIVVKAFNQEENAIETFGGFNDKLYDSAWRSQFLSTLMMPFTKFIGNLGYVAVCVLGGYYVATGKINLGDIQAFIQYVRNFSQPINQVANISNVLQQTAAAAERVFEFLEVEEEPKDIENPTPTKGIKGEVTFENVRFGYKPGEPVIRGFSAHVQPGQKIAIVGPTGAGKTTIVKLLMRFYDIDSGTISIDGHDIRTFTRSGLRSLFGMVLQDTWLYNATIADNIRYAKQSATDEEVQEAAWAAQAHRFIKTLPGAYNMELNEDATNISQGQKQLLTIARAILADPQILILDEATSSVDTRTEVHIQQAMDTLMEGRTSFIIAHRLSTIKNADCILVMREGDIVEIGTHDELLLKNGFYAELYQSQFDQPEDDAV